LSALEAVRLALVLALPAASVTPPTAPPNPQVVPVYSTPRQMRIRFRENGTAQTYNLLKQVGAGASTLFQTFAATTSGHLVEVFDFAVVSGESYTYVIEACNAAGCVRTPGLRNSPTIRWPVTNSHEILHGFNEPIGWAGLGDGSRPPVGFHNGVDINKTTTNPATGNDVVAPRGGVVRVTQTGAPGTTDNGAVFIRVEVGDGVVEIDSFNHLATGALFTTLTVGAVVEPGQKLGVIGTQWFGAGNFADHTHFSIASSQNPARTTIRHPLRLFESGADRDPMGKAPALCDDNADGSSVLYRVHPGGAPIAHNPVTTPIRGDIDVEVEVCDEQGTSPRQAPIDLGYWIEGPLPDSEQHDDVKSAARPYRLYDFRDAYYGAAPPTACTLVSDVSDLTNAGCPTVGCGAESPGGCAGSVLQEGSTPFPWPSLHYFIVTHAGDEVGARTSIATTEFWRTAATDDGAPATAPDANFAARPVTARATQARFPDGEYQIHVVASDLEHANVDLKLPVTRLENFAPFLKEVVVALDADGNAGSGRPGTPGCEALVYHFQHTHRQAYPRPQDVRHTSVPTTIARAGQKLCALLRFSEPVSGVSVDLVRERGGGSAVPASGFTGTLAKTHQTDDTWSGFVTLPEDATGESNASAGSDERDVALRVLALDRRDAAGAMRGLDADDDGAPDPAGDLNHVVVKLDLSVPTITLDVIKP
jgi:hypothetical protein